MSTASNRRTVITGMGATAAAVAISPRHLLAQPTPAVADVIFLNAKVTTLDRQNPQAEAVAIGGGRFLAVGSERDVMALAGPQTRRIDLKQRRVIPGLIDSHTHVIRGGLNYNMELRWDGRRSLADAMEMLKKQVYRT